MRMKGFGVGSEHHDYYCDDITALQIYLPICYFMTHAMNDIMAPAHVDLAMLG